MGKQGEVLVIGGGCMGMGIARSLAKAGLRVALFESGALGKEASWASAGMIGPQSEAMEPDDNYRATLYSRDLYSGFAAELAAETGLDLGYHPGGALHLAFGAGYERRLESKYLWQKEGAGKVTKLERPALDQRFPYFHPRVSAGYLAEGDQWIDNEKLLEALAAACRAVKVEIHENLPVEKIEVRDGKVCGLRAGGRLWEGEKVVLAVGAWGSKLLEGLFDKAPHFHPVRGQMLSFLVPESLFPPLPIHAENIYLVPRRPNRLVAGATVETVGFDKSVTGEGIEYVLQGAFETMPDLRQCPVDRLWAGFRPGSGDGWPVLGPCPLPGLHLACGHYRRGILLLPITVQALTQSVLQGSLPEKARAFRFERLL